MRGAPGGIADEPFDVAIVGAGIVGSAVARKLAEYRLRIALLDAREDVGDGTSKANTAILHTGFDAAPGTLESRLVRRGYRLLSDYAEQVGIPVERTGAVLVAWDREQLAALPGLREKAERNGYPDTRLVDAAEVYALLPHLGEGVVGGLLVPDESIICTWTTNLALATEAVLRGVDLRLLFRVARVQRDASVTHLVSADNRVVSARFVINAAGLGGDVIDGLFGHERFTVTPRRGELLVYDKQARQLVDRIVLPVPTARGKGVLISPTIYGNVMLGPTAEDRLDRDDTSTSEQGFEFLLGKGARLMPELLKEEVTASYAGLRAASSRSDYFIDLDPAQRYLLISGIRSTGLTSGMAIAEHAAELIAAARALPLDRRAELPEPPIMPNIGESFLRPYQDQARIARDEAYGRIVCFCERVTAGELRDAFESPIPPRTIGGLSRRTRAQNGRCQGFFCGAEVEEIFAAHWREAGRAPSRAKEEG